MPAFTTRVSTHGPTTADPHLGMAPARCLAAAAPMADAGPIGSTVATRA